MMEAPPFVLRLRPTGARPPLLSSFAGEGGVNEEGEETSEGSLITLCCSPHESEAEASRGRIVVFREGGLVAVEAVPPPPDDDDGNDENESPPLPSPPTSTSSSASTSSSPREPPTVLDAGEGPPALAAAVAPDGSRLALLRGERGRASSQRVQVLPLPR